MESKLESQTTIAAPYNGGHTTTAPIGVAGDATIPKRKRERTPYPLHKARWILRAITFVAEFITFFLIVGLSRSCSLDRGSFGCAVLFELVFVGIPMIWDIAEFITLCVNRKGIHPGAHIALDLILFGLLVGPASIIIVGWSFDPRDYYYDCSGNGPCTRVSNARRSGYRATGITSGTFMIISGLLHLALFIMACISVHRWRMQRREERFQLMQAAYRQPPPPHAGGPISIAGHMDPNMAYLVTYPDGRQVLVPPPGQQQLQHPQQAHMSQQFGYYAPQAQQGVSVAPVTATAVGAGPGLAGNAGHATERNMEHSPVSQVSAPHETHGAVPPQAADVVEAPSMGATPRPAVAETAVPDRGRRWPWK